MNFEIKKDKFYLNGNEFKIISGTVHYFRNMPCAWRDVFKKLKALGANTVETYCVWNAHEKVKNEYDFSGILNVSEFLKIAKEEGLYAIVRPGPYICAEWEFGGLPWWLQTEKDMEIRCNNKKYIFHFTKYLRRLFKELKSHLITNGGPIIMMQCENEYGYYGDDKDYLNYLFDFYRSEGIDVPLFTSDGPKKEVILDGCIEGALPTINFGSRVEENFTAHDELFPSSPKMCMEMWSGWFDTWGEKHHTASIEEYVKTANDMLNKGHFNTYMFIGGTNFGFFNGANHDEKYMPQITSYDYDALLTECGDVTEKYFAIRNVIKNHLKIELPPVPDDRQKASYGRVEFTEVATLTDNLQNLSQAIFSNVPKCMEEYGIGYGYVLYTTTLNRDYEYATLQFEDVGDRAHVYVNDKLVKILYVNDCEFKAEITAKKGSQLKILVENMGRANFGYKMMRKKGIIGRVLLDNKIHFNWQTYPLPFDDFSNLNFKKLGENNVVREPCFYKGNVNVQGEVKDTFLNFDNFRKGFVVINGFNIGRYWEIGPQKTLYVPSSILKEGNNEILVFETDGINCEPSMTFVDTPKLDG